MRYVSPLRQIRLGSALAVCLVSAAGAAHAQAPAPIAPATPPAAIGVHAPRCDANCVRTNMDTAAQACARVIETQAPIDYEWINRPFTGIFQEGDQSDEQSAGVKYRGDSIRFMSPQKEWLRITYECAFDVATKKVMAVRVRPGRPIAPRSRRRRRVRRTPPWRKRRKPPASVRRAGSRSRRTCWPRPSSKPSRSATRKTRQEDNAESRRTERHRDQPDQSRGA